MVRDRGAQGDEIRERHHRHVSRTALAGHRVRAAPSLHGRDRRRVPRLGLRERRQRLGERAIAAAAHEAGAEIRTNAPVAQRARQERPRDGRRARERRRDPREACRLERRSAAHVHAARRTRASARRLHASDRPLQVPRLVGQSEPRARRAPELHVPARRGPAPARRDLDQPEHRLPRARLRRREVRRSVAQAVHGHRHPVDDRSVDGAARASTSCRSSCSTCRTT